LHGCFGPTRKAGHRAVEAQVGRQPRIPEHLQLQAARGERGTAAVGWATPRLAKLLQRFTGVVWSRFLSNGVKYFGSTDGAPKIMLSHVFGVRRSQK
jgi:hypothetical protein